MDEKQKQLINKLEIIGFLAYFFILFCERVLALVFSVKMGGEYALSSGNTFNYFAYPVTAASLLLGTVFAVKPCMKMIGSLVKGNAYDLETEGKPLTIAVGVILVSGMMHTGFTLAGVQFAAYGFLIAAMVLRTVEKCFEGGDKYLIIVSVVYLVLFSMAIPVCYLSTLGAMTRTRFYAAEFLAVFTLVPIFSYLFYRFICTGVTDFSPIFPGVMAFLSGATVFLKWDEEINYFVLIFMSLAVIAYLAFGILAWRRVKLAKSTNTQE